MFRVFLGGFRGLGFRVEVFRAFLGFRGLGLRCLGLMWVVLQIRVPS